MLNTSCPGLAILPRGGLANPANTDYLLKIKLLFDYGRSLHAMYQGVLLCLRRGVVACRRSDKEAMQCLK